MGRNENRVRPAVTPFSLQLEARAIHGNIQAAVNGLWTSCSMGRFFQSTNST
jgi:hypothetical protein